MRTNWPRHWRSRPTSPSGTSPSPPAPTLKDLIPASLAQASRVLPQAGENGYLRCVATGPLAAEVRAELEFLAGRPVRLAVARESDFAHYLQELYGVTVESMIEGMEKIEGEAGGDQEIYLHDLQEMAREPTLINLVNMIVSNAIEQRASDIHIEPFEAQLKIKYRIDGILHEMPPPQAPPVRDHLTRQDHGRDGHRRALRPAGRPVLRQPAR